MLAKEYHKGMPAPRSDPEFNPPVGWLASEKYDGYRARWMGKMKDKDEKVFLSRAKKLFMCESK